MPIAREMLINTEIAAMKSTRRTFGLATRLWCAVSLGMVALSALFGTAAWQMIDLQQRGSAELALADAKARGATEWASLTDTNIARMTGSTLGYNPELIEAFKAPIGQSFARIDEIRRHIGAMPQSEQEKALVAQLDRERDALLAAQAEAMRFAEAGDMQMAKSEFEKRFNPAAQAYLKSVQAYAALQQAEARRLSDGFAAARDRVLRASGAGLLLLLAAIALGARALIRSIHSPLHQAVGLARRITAGDLTAAIRVDRGDEFGDLQRSLGEMSGALARLVGQVRDTSGGVAAASREIAHGSQDLSGRTERASAWLQRTTQAMQELTSTVQQAVQAADSADTLAREASAAAQRGGRVIADVVSSMDDIAATAKQISTIIGVIDGISFQTNILALNAAVEAARAGAQGRGFAVVASEVRGLAQSSAQAAREIKALITASIERVESGARLVGAAGQSMSEIVASTARVNDTMQRITRSTARQHEGLAEVTSAVQQLDDMTQQNAALVEQSSAAAQSLSDQAGELLTKVNAFRTMAAAGEPSSAGA